MPHPASSAPRATPSTLTLRAPPWRWPLAWVLTLIVFLVLDAIWLSTMTALLYRPSIGHLMASSPDWLAAAVFYPLYVVGVVFFAVEPGVSQRRAAIAFARGAALGLLAYGTYDFTNQATLRDWPWAMTLIDLAWGAAVTGSAAGIAAALTLLTCRRATRTSAR